MKAKVGCGERSPSTAVLPHLEDLWVVVHLALVAALAHRGGSLGEVAAFVQQEQSLAVLLLQPLQFPSVLPMDGGLGGQDEVAPRPGWGHDRNNTPNRGSVSFYATAIVLPSKLIRLFKNSKPFPIENQFRILDSVHRGTNVRI